MPQKFGGKTADAGVIILGAGYWAKGVRITGIYTRKFMTPIGECMEFLCMLPKSITVPTKNGKFDLSGQPTEIDHFSIGNLTGFEMAVDVLKTSDGFGDFKMKDRVQIECVGLRESTGLGKSPMPEFELSVERD